MDLWNKYEKEEKFAKRFVGGFALLIILSNLAVFGFVVWVIYVLLKHFGVI